MMKHTDSHDPRRCDTGKADYWGACFACGAVKGEQCRDPKPAPHPAAPEDQDAKP